MYIDYYKIVSSILEHKEFEKRKEYMHHDNSSVYDHSLKVSIISYKVAKILHLDKKSVAIGALLHDFYYKPWLIEGKVVKNESKIFLKGHGFVHARQALENSYIHFPELMNSKIDDIIVKHMFPLNILPPVYLESWIVSLCDKYVSLEIFKSPKKLHKYVGIKSFPKINIIKKRG